MELVMYIRDKRFRDIVDEEIRKIYKKDSNGNLTTKIDKKEYWVRLGRARPIGVLVSNSQGSIGWSLVHDPDQFNREDAFKFARAREQNPNKKVFVIGKSTDCIVGGNEQIPNKIKKLYKIMLEKSNKAFSKK